MSVTVFPPIGFPNPSSAVTVIVAALPPTVIVCGAAVTVVRDALTAPARLVARKFRGLATPVACTAWVVSVAVARVPSVHCVEAMPWAFVLELGGFT